MIAARGLLAATLFAVPLACCSQPRLPVVGLIFTSAGPMSSSPLALELLDGLRDQGFVDGRNVRIEPRFADGRLERMPQLARELVALKPDVLWVPGEQGVVAAALASDSVPIVSFTCDPPEGIRLSRPGGRVTGVTCMHRDLNGKRIQLLRELIPRLSKIAVLYNPLDSTKRAEFAELRESMKKEHLTLLPFEASYPEQFEQVFAMVAKNKVGAVLVLDDLFTYVSMRTIATLAAKHRLPSIYGFSEYAGLGGLATYGPDARRLARRTAGYLAKILKGEDAGTLPIELPTQFDLVLNAKTAKTLGIKIPKSVLLRTDRMIE